MEEDVVVFAADAGKTSGEVALETTTSVTSTLGFGAPRRCAWAAVMIASSQDVLTSFMVARMLSCDRNQIFLLFYNVGNYEIWRSRD
jgi:hypothetical protein